MLLKDSRQWRRCGANTNITVQVVGSLTDATVKDTNSAPWSKDLLITAEKRVNGEHLTKS